MGMHSNMQNLLLVRLVLLIISKQRVLKENAVLDDTESGHVFAIANCNSCV